MRVEHGFGPIYNEQSKILILGTIPSVKSREAQFYYHHPQNRFWKTVAGVLGVPVPESVEEKKAMLLDRHVAVYDVLESCDIEGSADATIRNPKAADLAPILETAPIRAIYANGAKAEQLYNKYTKKTTGRDIVRLPSTSPANAAWTLDKLLAEWTRLIAPCMTEES